jgi:hypothetical protein
MAVYEGVFIGRMAHPFCPRGSLTDLGLLANQSFAVGHYNLCAASYSSGPMSAKRRESAELFKSRAGVRAILMTNGADVLSMGMTSCQAS